MNTNKPEVKALKAQVTFSCLVYTWTFIILTVLRIVGYFDNETYDRCFFLFIGMIYILLTEVYYCLWIKMKKEDEGIYDH